MPPLTVTVIEDLDVLRDLAPSLLTGLIATMMHQLILQHSPETLHPHGWDHAELPQRCLIHLGTILSPAIGVMNEPRGWTVGVDVLTLVG